MDVLALMGDAIDNIKGVPGIGEKGARDLIATYGSLDALLAHAGEVPQKKLSRGAARARRRRRARAASWLRIRTDVPVRVRHPRRSGTAARRASAATRCSRELGFRTLVDGVRADGRDRSTKDYAVVDTPSDARGAGRRRCERPGGSRCACCPTGRPAMRAGIVGLAFSTAPAAARGTCRSGTQGSLGATRPRSQRRTRSRALKPVLEDPAIGKVGHDLKFDAIVLARHGVALRGLDSTRCSPATCSTPRGRRIRSRTLALEHLGYKALTEEDVCGSGAKAMPLARLPAEAALDYAGERADLALQLARRARADCSSTRGARRRSTATLELPLRAGAGRHRARRRPRRRAGAGGAVAAHRAGARARRPRASSSWPAASSTSTRRSSSPRSCSTSCSCPR